MKIFIIGGTGFIGSHLINELSSKNFEIISTKRKNSIPRVLIKKEPLWIDSENISEIKSALHKSNILVNCAAVGVSPQKSNWSEMIDYNITQTIMFLIIAKEAGVKNFLYLGTDMEANSKLYSKKKAQNLTPYTATKTAAFHLIASYSIQNRLNMKYIKLPNVYGEGQYPLNLWPSLRGAALSGKDFKILNKNHIKNFLSIKKTVKLISNALDSFSSSNKKFEIINIKGEEKKVGEFAEKFWTKWKAKGKLIYEGK